MMNLENIVRATQKELFSALCKQFSGNYHKKRGYVLVQGEVPVLLVAHLDTVHKERVRDICTTTDGNIIMSPQGIGGDDRCGVFALLTAHKAAKAKPWLLFTCDEEIGGYGAEAFCDDYQKGLIPADIDDIKLIVEIDRKGQNDAVYYDCDNPDFEAYITSKGFSTAYGSFSDISYIAPELGIAAVNLSSGYYNAHTQHEYINKKHLRKTIDRVLEIVADASKPDFQRYGYISYYDVLQAMEDSYYGLMEYSVPNDVPEQYRQMYDELLDVFTVSELEMTRKKNGDAIIAQLYNDCFCKK